MKMKMKMTMLVLLMMKNDGRLIAMGNGHHSVVPVARKY